MINIGENIRNFRRIKGLNQAELAEKTGVTLHTIHKYEKGKTSPRFSFLVKAAVVLDVSLFELIKGVN